MALPTGYIQARRSDRSGLRKTNRLINAILDGCEILAKGKKGNYVCFPITTGYRLWKLASEHGINSFSAIKGPLKIRLNYERRVLEPNIRAGRRFVQFLEKRYRLVYDPSQLSIQGWSQNDYYRLWRKLIFERISTVHMVEGWQYSEGCVLECVWACQMGKRIRDHLGHIITPARSLTLIQAAFEEGNENAFNMRLWRQAAKMIIRVTQ